MQRHAKLFVASTLFVLAIIGVGSVSGDPNEPPTGPPPPDAKRPWMPGHAYGPGEGAVWSRSDLTLAEQELLDRPDPTMPGDANERYGDALSFQASFAEARMASARLGLGGLQELGVVP